MKKKPLLIGLFLSLFLPFSTLAESPSSLKEEFKVINTSRDARTSLIDYLKSNKVVIETAEGILKADKTAPDSAKEVIEQENKDRLRQFEIIAKLESTTPALVALQFAKRMGVDTSKPNIETTLRIHGSNTVGASLAPELARAYLDRQGFTNIAIEKEGVESFITYKRPGKEALGRIEIKAHGSSTAFKETSASKEVGISGGFADLGMASRPMKSKEQSHLVEKGFGDLRTAACEFPIALDGVAVILNRRNSVSQLTVNQIAGLFSGEITNWKELGGPDQPVKIFARDEQSGTWDTFKSRVLKPTKRKLATSNVKRFENSELLVRHVASTPGSIGFTGLAYVDSTVKSLGVRAGNEARPFQATRLTVKTQDYPLARLLYFYLPIDSPTIARDFVKFTMSNEGQKIVDSVGLVGQGLSTNKDRKNADQFKRTILADTTVPQAYKNLIQPADRKDTQANIRFEAGSMTPDINSLNNLDRLSSYLAEAGNENTKVVLIGFADSIGSASNNLKLSKKRAETIKELLASRGVRNITAEGFGEAMPVADNNSNAGRAKNRRVEIWLKR